MKLILIDSGLKHIKGHNFSTDLYIAKYFKEKNFDVEILCLKNIDKETEDKFQKNKIKIKKIFDISTYSAVPYENEDTIIKSIEITVNSIKLYLKKNPFPDIAIWVPTNYPIQIFSNLFLKVARRPFIFLDAVYSNFSNNTINLYVKFLDKFKQRKDIIYLVYEENVKETFLVFYQ